MLVFSELRYKKHVFEIFPFATYEIAVEENEKILYLEYTIIFQYFKVMNLMASQ